MRVSPCLSPAGYVSASAQPGTAHKVIQANPESAWTYLQTVQIITVHHLSPSDQWRVGISLVGCSHRTCVPRTNPWYTIYMLFAGYCVVRESVVYALAVRKALE